MGPPLRGGLSHSPGVRGPPSTAGPQGATVPSGRGQSSRQRIREQTAIPRNKRSNVDKEAARLEKQVKGILILSPGRVPLSKTCLNRNLEDGKKSDSQSPGEREGLG